MKNKELIEILEGYNQDAEVSIVSNNRMYKQIEISYGTSEGCIKDNCDTVFINNIETNINKDGENYLGFKVGDLVKVVNPGLYPLYDTFFSYNKILKRTWKENVEIPLDKRSTYTIEALGKHHLDGYNNDIAVILDDLDNQYLIDVEGLCIKGGN